MIQIRIFSAGLAKSPSLPSARNDLGNCLPSKGAFGGEGIRTGSTKLLGSNQPWVRMSPPCSCVLFWQTLWVKRLKGDWICLLLNAKKFSFPVF